MPHATDNHFDAAACNTQRDQRAQLNLTQRRITTHATDNLRLASRRRVIHSLTDIINFATVALFCVVMPAATGNWCAWRRIVMLTATPSTSQVRRYRQQVGCTASVGRAELRTARMAPLPPRMALLPPRRYPCQRAGTAVIRSDSRGSWRGASCRRRAYRADWPHRRAAETIGPRWRYHRGAEPRRCGDRGDAIERRYRLRSHSTSASLDSSSRTSARRSKPRAPSRWSRVALSVLRRAGRALLVGRATLCCYSSAGPSQYTELCASASPPCSTADDTSARPSCLLSCEGFPTVSAADAALRTPGGCSARSAGPAPVNWICSRSASTARGQIIWRAAARGELHHRALGRRVDTVAHAREGLPLRRRPVLRPTGGQGFVAAPERGAGCWMRTHRLPDRGLGDDRGG